MQNNERFVVLTKLHTMCDENGDSEKSKPIPTSNGNKLVCSVVTFTNSHTHIHTHIERLHKLKQLYVLFVLFEFHFRRNATSIFEAIHFCQAKQIAKLKRKTTICWSCPSFAPAPRTDSPSSTIVRCVEVRSGLSCVA